MSRFRTGKLITATVSYDAEKEEWAGSIAFEHDLIPLELSDGLAILETLDTLIKKTARQMIDHAVANHARNEALDADIASGRIKPS
jgi:hypothetical protein